MQSVTKTKYNSRRHVICSFYHLCQDMYNFVIWSKMEEAEGWDIFFKREIYSIQNNTILRYNHYSKGGRVFSIPSLHKNRCREKTQSETSQNLAHEVGDEARLKEPSLQFGCKELHGGAWDPSTRSGKELPPHFPPVWGTSSSHEGRKL